MLMDMMMKMTGRVKNMPQKYRTSSRKTQLAKKLRKIQTKKIRAIDLFDFTSFFGLHYDQKVKEKVQKVFFRRARVSNPRHLAREEN